jgi:hypothetical protein
LPQTPIAIATPIPMPIPIAERAIVHCGIFARGIVTHLSRFGSSAQAEIGVGVEIKLEVVPGDQSRSAGSGDHRRVVGGKSG